MENNEVIKESMDYLRYLKQSIKKVAKGDYTFGTYFSNLDRSNFDSDMDRIYDDDNTKREAQKMT